MFAELAATVLFTPFAAFIILLIFGRGPLRKVADYFSIGMMAIAFVAAVALFYKVMTHPDAGSLADNPLTYAWDWMKLGKLNLTVGLLIDPLSSFMAIVVTGLATLVLIFSVFYLYGDTMYYKYFMFMNFFCFTMLGIVFSENIFMTFIFWELVGLGSYFLIGFWFYKPPVSQDHHYQELKAKHATGIDEETLSPAFAQKKAFVMNRIGDFGFISGVGIFFTVMVMVACGWGVKPSADLLSRTGQSNPQTYVAQTQKALESRTASGENHSGLVSFTTLYKARATGVFEAVELDIFGWKLSGIELLTLATILTFMGAMGKSAQFPLHTWLPDAMQGPTTGSSIIHAATMVAAGVYMTARIHPLLTEQSMFFVAMIGGITAFVAASIACVQWDIKAVLAYSTISQLGYMMVGLGTNGAVESFGYSAGVAHLFTHAFFKCMLFLCAGSVIHACHHNQDMFKMGGLRKKLPLTFTAMLFGCFAIAGVPLFSGFFSKDAILVSAMFYGKLPGHDWYHFLPYGLGAVTAVMTACYMFRMLLMTFTGTPKDWAAFAGVHAQKAWGLGKVADLFGPPPAAPAGMDLAALEAAAHHGHGHGHDDHGHDHGHDDHGHDSHATHDAHDAHGHDSHGHDAHGHDAHGAHGEHGDHGHGHFVATALADETNRPGPFPYHPPEHDVSYGVRSPGLLALFEALPLAVLALMTFGFWYSGDLGLPVVQIPLPFFSAPASHVGADNNDAVSPDEKVSWIDRYLHRPRVEFTLAADMTAKKGTPNAYTLVSVVDSIAREGHAGGHGEHGPEHASLLPFETVAYAAEEGHDAEHPAPAPHAEGAPAAAAEHATGGEHPTAGEGHETPAHEAAGHEGHAAHGEAVGVPHYTGELAELHSAHHIHELHHRSHIMAGLIVGMTCVVLGIGMALLFYWMWPRGGKNPHAILTAGPLQALWIFLANLWFLDKLYDRVFVGGGKLFSGLCAKFDSGFIDKVCVDGWGVVGKGVGVVVGTFDMWVVDKLVDLWGWIAGGLGAALRWIQTGKVQTYVFLSGLAIVAMVIALNFGERFLQFFR